MSSRDFCYWLQGLFELRETAQITPKQEVLIQKHLALVFKHEIDPSMGDKNHQDQLNKIHPSDTMIRC